MPSIYTIRCFALVAGLVITGFSNATATISIAGDEWAIRHVIKIGGLCTVCDKEGNRAFVSDSEGNSDVPKGTVLRKVEFRNCPTEAPGIDILRNASMLYDLDIDHSYLTKSNIDVMKMLPLRVLTVKCNGKLPASMFTDGFKSLLDLRIESAELTTSDIARVSSVTTLRELAFIDCHYPDNGTFSHTKTLTSIESLTLPCMADSSQLQTLPIFNRLKELTVCNSTCDANAIDAISSQPSLEVLNLYECFITAPSLMPLNGSRLTSLVVNGSRFEAGAISTIRGKVLDYVSLHDVVCSPSDVVKMCESNKIEMLAWDGANLNDALFNERCDIKVLQISGSAISDETCKGISRIPSLKKLDAFGGCKYISDEGLKAISSLKHLEELSIGCTESGISGVEYIARMSSLKRLSIGGMRFDDTCLLRTAEIKSLEQLSVWDSRVSRSGIDRFTSLRPTCILKLFGEIK